MDHREEDEFLGYLMLTWVWSHGWKAKIATGLRMSDEGNIYRKPIGRKLDADMSPGRPGP